MRTVFIFVLVASFVPPAALATTTLDGCHADLVCTAESQGGESCEDFASGTTDVTLIGTIVVRGHDECYPGGGSEGLSVTSPVTSAYWGEFHYSDPEHGDFQSCYVYAADGFVYRALPCSLGAPPNPGWGSVLP